MQVLLAARSAGVKNKAVLSALERVDRAAFVSDLFQDRAFDDTPLPISCGQTISQPSIVGLMTEALDVGPRHKVLEIGTGSGYQAAILAQLARRVYTVERFVQLSNRARDLFSDLKLTNITTLAADGSRGVPDQAPFDRILMTAAAEDPPAPLLAQLRMGGIMVLPVGQSDHVQNLIKVTKTQNGLDYEELRPVRFVPLLEGVDHGQ